jgi:hypothetical protein
VESGRNILEGGNKLIHTIYHDDTTLGVLDSEDESTTILHSFKTLETTHTTKECHITQELNLPLPAF